MHSVWLALVGFLGTILRCRLSLQLEVVALRHQLSVYERSRRRLPIELSDRILWSWLARLWPSWRQHLHFVRPPTVLEWQKRRFRECLDNIIVFNERHLRRTLANYFEYYYRWRVHRSLEIDTPRLTAHRATRARARCGVP